MSRSDRRSVFSYAGDKNIDTDIGNFSLSNRLSRGESQSRLLKAAAYRLPSRECVIVNIFK